jgi:uncharacterized protein
VLVAQLEKIITITLPSGGDSTIGRWRFGTGDAPRVTIVAGIRGDTPEGMRVAYSLMQTLGELESRLKGTIDIYPCVNPLAAEQGRRFWPFFEVDLNRLFPGKEYGHPPDRVAYRLIQSAQGSDYVWELRGARPSFRETTQALVRSGDDVAAKLAQEANVQVIWRRTLGPAAPSTFAYQFPHAIVLEGGAGNRLTASVGKDLHDGVLNMLCSVGIIPEEHLPIPWAAIERPLIVGDSEVIRIGAESSGLFLPATDLGDSLPVGGLVGHIIAPESGKVLREIVVTQPGMVMAIREHPVVTVGMMVARILSPGEGT